MVKCSAIDTSELIDFIATQISRRADWREGFGDLLEYINCRLATGSGFVKLYHYISGRYIETICRSDKSRNPIVDDVFSQMAIERKPVALPVEYADFLPGQLQYSVVGIPFVKNGDYLGGLVLAGTDGEGVRESHFYDLLSYTPYLLPMFESAVLQEILLSNYLEAIETLAVALEAKDPYTRGHSNMVTAYAVAIARKLGLDDYRIQAIEIGAMMHDIGKIGVPDDVLRKPGRLTNEEFEIVKKHPEIGEEILKPMQHPLFDIPKKIVRWHHERIDGKGYPDGLTGNQIPLEAKITFVADAYDAMTADRPYREALPPETAFAELRKNAGTQFEPEFVEVLHDLLQPAGERTLKSDEQDTGETDE